METIKPNKPNVLSIFVPGVLPNKALNDFRTLQKYGDIHFGTISQVAKNLGISMKIVDNGLTFSAPRARLQMFVEKLHFSMVGYREM
jgi:hypothetical protein